MTLTVGGTEVAVILVEQASGQFKLSLRSRSDVDCSKLAEIFQGGGHKRAAGATLDGPLEAAQARVLEVVRAAMQECKNPKSKSEIQTNTKFKREMTETADPSV